MTDAKTTRARFKSPRLWIATCVCALVSVVAMLGAGSLGTWYPVANWVGAVAMLAAGVLAGFALVERGSVDAPSENHRRRLFNQGFAAVVVGVTAQFLINMLILNQVVGSAVWSLLVEATSNALIVIGAVFIAVSLISSRDPEPSS